jgi:YHS domain-containing protein/thiol-disulfide isomerase/thioredoxin
MITARRWPRLLSTIVAVVGCFAVVSLPRAAIAGVAWHESYAAAKAASQTSQRPVLVIFTASWCEACQHLDSRLWANAEASALVAACYEPVVVDVDAHPELARQMGISHIPSACVTNSRDQLLTTFDLPPTASTFVAQAARALHATAATTVVPTTTIPSQPIAQPTPAAPQAFQPAAAAPAAPPATSNPAFAADTGSRYAQTPGSSFGAPPAAAPAFANQQPPRAAINPAQVAASAPQEAPWLATPPAAAPPAAYAQQPTIAPQAGYPQQPPTASQQVAPGQYPLSPPGTPTASQPRGATPGGYAASGLGATQTTTPYPTPPQNLDSSAMATDREAEDKPQKATLMGTLQKQFAFMMPKQEAPEEAADAPAATSTPSPYPVGFDGFCPVTLAEQAKWAEGRAQWGVQHRGRTYLFVGPEEQQRFLANPDRYAPALSGDDVVLAFESGQQLPGQRRYGVTYQAKIYLFSSLETRSRFAANPQAYASRVRLAESPTAAPDTMLR